MISHLNSFAAGWWSWMVPMLWQTALLAVFVIAMDIFLRRRGWPQVRYALWLVLLARLVIPPSFATATSISSRLLALISVPEAKVQVHEIRPAAPIIQESPAARMPAVESAPVQSTVPPAAITSAAVVAPVVRLTAQAWAMLISTSISLFFAAWLASRMVRLYRLASRGSRNVPPHINEALARSAAQLRVRQLPRVLITESLPSAAVCGIFRPTLFLPKSYLDLPSEQLGHILLHELAHLKRGDLVVNAVQALLHIVYWFNPMLWIAGRRLRHLREMCCDATVSAVLRERTHDYCVTLLNAAERASRGGMEMGLGLLGLFESPARLCQRIEQLGRPSWRHRRLRQMATVALSTAVLFCVLPMAAVKAAPKADAAAKAADVEVKAVGNGGGRAVQPAGADKAAPKTNAAASAVKVEAKAAGAGSNREPQPIDAAKAEIMGRVEQVFMTNFRDITARKTIRWGEVAVDEDGNRSIEYEYNAIIWDKDVMTCKETYTFDPQGSFVSRVVAEGYPRKVNQRPADTSTQEGMISLVEKFFTQNFRDITARNPIEWGEREIRNDGNISIRYKYVARMRGGDLKEMNQIFTFTPKGEYVSFQNVDGYPKERESIEDPTDQPFVDDPALLGTWESVDFVKDIAQFVPGKMRWTGDLYLRGMMFAENGHMKSRTDSDRWAEIWHWTKGLIIHPGAKTAAKYEIQNLNGKDYLFFEWKSGDYTMRGMKPWYYVLVRTEEAAK